MTKEEFREASSQLRAKLDNNEEHQDYAIATDSVRALLDLAENKLPTQLEKIKDMMWSTGPITVAKEEETLRDKFAMSALPAFIALMKDCTDEKLIDELPKISYHIADEMIKARKDG